MSPSAYIVLTIFLFIPVSIGLVFAVIGIVKSCIRKSNERKRIAYEEKLIKEEQEVSKYSRVVMKINELNQIFSPFADTSYAHYFSGFDNRRSKFEYDEWRQPQSYILRYYNDLASASLVSKKRHNHLTKQYMSLYNSTINNVHTPDEYIQKTVYSKEKFKKIENVVIKKLCIMKEDSQQISFAITVRYIPPKGRNRFWHIYSYNENDIFYQFNPSDIKTDYVPKDLEWEQILKRREDKRIAREKYENMVKSLPNFLASIKKVADKKERADEIESSIQIIGGVHYYIFDSYALVGGYEGDLKAVTIADTVSVRGRELPVTGILEKSFINSSNLKEVVIPSSVEIIGDSAFSGCYQLKEIYLPDSVKYIGSKAFESCFSLSKASLAKDAFVESNSFEMCNKCIIARR